MRNSGPKQKTYNIHRNNHYNAELVKLLFLTSQDLLFIIESGKFIDVNDVVCEKLGYCRKDIIDLPPSRVLAEETLSILPRLKSELMAKRFLLENIVLVSKSGQKIYTELNIHLLKYHNTLVALAIARDITGRLQLEAAWKELLSGLEANVTQRNSELLQINRELQLEVLERAKAEQALAEKELQLRLITDNMTDIIIHVDPAGIIRYISPSCLVTLGRAPAHFCGGYIFELTHEHDIPVLSATLEQALAAGVPVSAECRLHHESGRWVWIEGAAKCIRDTEDRVLGAVISCRDITNRKRMEEQLKYQAIRDPITGLYNRTYFEMEMSRLTDHRRLQVGLIVCDLDGLKYVNDTLGYDAGDQLLLNVAKLIQNCFGDTEIVARIGGDEFAVIFPVANDDLLSQARGKIKEAVAAYNTLDPKIPICLSIGRAITSTSVAMGGLFKEADNSMYREKLHSQHSSRSSVVNALKKALEVRDFVTDGHATRLIELTLRLAKMCGFPEYRLTDLRLFAEFHDIGKVGIPDVILFKSESLSAEETTVMHSHSEIGHRIAISTPDLEPIADWILKHHEWWNGNGYPLKLKGTKIPLECRILSIADAYDAMTNDRPYRKALPHEVAISEIIRCAGTQFDPDLVAQFTAMMQLSQLAAATTITPSCHP